MTEEQSERRGEYSICSTYFTHSTYLLLPTSSYSTYLLDLLDQLYQLYPLYVVYPVLAPSKGLVQRGLQGGELATLQGRLLQGTKTSAESAQIGVRRGEGVERGGIHVLRGGAKWSC